MIEYRIVEKAAFTIMGKAKRFSFENCYKEIPKYWDCLLYTSSFISIFIKSLVASPLLLPIGEASGITAAAPASARALAALRSG